MRRERGRGKKRDADSEKERHFFKRLKRFGRENIPKEMLANNWSGKNNTIKSSMWSKNMCNHSYH